MKTQKIIQQINEIQKENDLFEIQRLITTGDIWKFQGSMGRFAMECLRSGACYLGDEPTFDYYNNRIPARDEVQAGTTGSLENSMEYYELN